MRSLTARQTEVLDFVRKHIAQHGFPPTIAEIAAGLAIRSPNAVRDHLRALEKKEAIQLTPSRSRGIQLLEAETSDLRLPLVGRVAAGIPILAEQNIEEHYAVDQHFFRPRAHYLLRVHGSSMQNAGILDADLLAVHQTQEAHNGQIVVARIEDEVTVKRLRYEKHTALLLPENEAFDPIEVDLRTTELSIEGIGVGVLRNHTL